VFINWFVRFFYNLCPWRVYLLNFYLVQTLIIKNTKFNSNSYFIQLPTDPYFPFIYLEFTLLQIHVYTASNDWIFIHNLVSLSVQEIIVPFIGIDTYHKIVNLVQWCVFIICLEKSEHKTRPVCIYVYDFHRKLPKPLFDCIVVYK